MIGLKRKIVTLCGSMKFLSEMQETAERLELERGYIVLTAVPHVLKRELTEDEKNLLGRLHRSKIDLSDAIFVVNPGGYIGQSVRSEIEYARSAGKEVLFLENN